VITLPPAILPPRGHENYNPVHVLRYDLVRYVREMMVGAVEVRHGQPAGLAMGERLFFVSLGLLMLAYAVLCLRRGPRGRKPFYLPDSWWLPFFRTRAIIIGTLSVVTIALGLWPN
jgi:hypothetical protein